MRANPSTWLGLFVAVGIACHGTMDPADTSTDTDTASDTDAAPDTDGPLVSDPFDPAMLAVTYAEALCHHREICEPVYAAYLPETPSECRASVVADIRATWDALVPFVDGGEVAFVRAEFDRCVQAFGDAEADCDLGPAPLACTAMFHGGIRSGGACGVSQVCRPGLWCDAKLGGCGTCQPYAANGEDCSASACAPGLDCFSVDGAGSMRCSPVTAELDAPCGTLETGICRGHLQCDGDTTYTCKRPAALSTPCDTTGVLPDCDLESGMVCGADATCVDVQIVGPAETCGESSPTHLCDANSFCDFASGRCAALPAPDSLCTAGDQCAAGAWCEAASSFGTRGTCRAEFPAGESCTDSVQCEQGAYCVDGLCGPLEFDETCE